MGWFYSGVSFVIPRLVRDLPAGFDGTIPGAVDRRCHD